MKHVRWWWWWYTRSLIPIGALVGKKLRVTDTIINALTLSSWPAALLKQGPSRHEQGVKGRKRLSFTQEEALCDLCLYVCSSISTLQKLYSLLIAWAYIVINVKPLNLKGTRNTLYIICISLFAFTFINKSLQRTCIETPTNWSPFTERARHQVSFIFMYSDS